MNQTLIRNVNIWTMDEEDTRFYGWVLLENGKIASMGEGEPPAMPVQIDGDVVYGEGGVLTPGLIDIHSHIGLYEDGLGFEGADGNEDTDPATPHLRALDGVNPFDRSFREALEAGVTAAAVSPGSANPIGGQIALLKTAGRRVDDMILKAPLAIKFALGENPKSVQGEGVFLAQGARGGRSGAGRAGFRHQDGSTAAASLGQGRGTFSRAPCG